MPQSTSLPLLSNPPSSRGGTYLDYSGTRNNLAVGGGGAMKNGEYVDQSRNNSMASRGRHSISSGGVSNINSPRRVRRRKDPTPFNVLIVGAKNAGKSSFIEFLKTALAAPSHPNHSNHPTPRMTTTDGTFSSYYLESDIEGERVGLTLWDSQGLEKNVVDLQLREMTSFIESKFEDTFSEEQKVMRSPGAAKDTHIHCVFLLLDPSRLDVTVSATKKHVNGNAFAAAAETPSGLDADLDLQVMKTLSGKTTVIPVISKADTLTAAHMAYLKRNVWASIQAEKLDPLEALGLDDSDDEESDPDSEDAEHENSDAEDALPIQHTTSEDGSSEMVDAKENQEQDISDITDSTIDQSSSSPAHKTASSATTPSPAKPLSSSSPGKMQHFRSTSAQGPRSDELYIPFSLLSPDPYDPDVIGRQFPWGMADPYKPSHCDFVRLRDSVFAEWRTELRSAAREKWYEGWRTSRLKRTPQRIRQAGGVTPVSVVPREGRTASGGARSPGAQGLGVGMGSPYGSAAHSIRPSTSSKAENGFGHSQGSPYAGRGY